MIKKCRVVVSPPISRQEVIDNRDLEWRKAAQLALQLRLERRKKDRLDEIPPMGAIYLMSRSDVENLGVGKVEAPELPLQFLRIHRQRGRFIQPTYPGLLAEAGLFDRWVFHHTEVGLPFICPALGVSRETLMPEEIESIDTTGSSPPAV
jgi:hypothetical protein